MLTSAPVPKAVLYYNPLSVWVSAVLLGLNLVPRLVSQFPTQRNRKEKGYNSDELEFKAVDLRNGENFSPAYIRINPNGTVPTLVVPLENTLAAETPKKYCALTDTKSVLEFLDKSRSATSRTNTTSLAPAPALSPATMALSEISNNVIDSLHSVPVNFLSVAASTPDGLVARANSPRGEYVKRRQAALQRYMRHDAQGANEKVKRLWETRHTENGFVVRVYAAAGVPVTDLIAQEKQEREAFFRKSITVWTGIKDILTRLENEMIGPYTLGDQLSLSDMHLGAWFTRLLFVSGTLNLQAPDTQAQAPRPEHTPQLVYSGFKKLEDTLRDFTGDDAFILGSKIRAFFELFKDRESWRQVYAQGLH